MDRDHTLRQQIVSPNRVLSTALFFLLLVNFVLGYIGHTYYSDGLLDISSLGFWIGSGNFAIIAGIVLYCKRALQWSWADLGLGKPDRWWQPLLIGAGTYGAIMLFSMYVRPYILALGERPDISHLLHIQGSLPNLILGLIVVWITAAFLEELIFRAFMINALDKLMGSTTSSSILALVVSSMIFGLVHAYQGVTGILMTGSLGFIFGVAYLLNGRRIWPLIIIHGAIDTIGLISIYNM
ncbi:MAG: CPBP family intramembrane glutamic endopeptidase [Bacteroidota bacterium]